jgi:hypothetical protein
MKMINKLFVMALLGVLASLAFASAITLPPQVVIGASPNPANMTSTITAIGIDLSGSGIDYVRIYEDGIKVKECAISSCVFVAVHTTPGIRSYYAEAADNKGETDISDTINVNFQNSAPVLNAIGTQTVNENSTLTFTISGYDYNGDSMTYSAFGLGLLTGATFNATNQTFAWTPTFAQSGSYFVTFLVSDGSLSDSEIVQIDVVDVPLLDTVLPLVQFVSPTETSGSTISRNYILVNVTASDVNFANVTLNLYNLTGLINSTASATSPLFLNFTNLSDGVYYFNASAYDMAGNVNYTETRTVTINTSAAGGGNQTEEEDEGGTVRIRTVNSDDLIKGYYVSMNVGDRLKFNFCGSPYYIKLTDVDTDDDKAAFMVIPGTNGFVLKEGTSEKIDLDSDSLNDILFRLESTSTNRAKVYIKRTSDLCAGESKEGAIDLTSIENFEKLLPREEKSNLSYVAGFLLIGVLLCILIMILNSMGTFRRR